MSERNHSSANPSRNSQEVHRDSHSRAHRDSLSTLPPRGRLERANSDYAAPQQQGPAATQTQTYHSNNDHHATAPKTSTSTPVGSRPSLDSRRLSFPVRSPSYRASSSTSPTRDDGQDREGAGYHPYAHRPVAGDYTPRTFPTLGDVLSSERSGVAGRSEVDVGGGDPGPTWDQYLTDRQGSSARRDVLDRSTRASV